MTRYSYWVISIWAYWGPNLCILLYVNGNSAIRLRLHEGYNSGGPLTWSNGGRHRSHYRPLPSSAGADPQDQVKGVKLNEELNDAFQDNLTEI